MKTEQTNDKRIIIYYFVVFALFVLLAVLIFGKACKISLADGKAWRTLGEKYAARDSIEMLSERGNIYACGGELLATNEYRFRMRMDFGVKTNGFLDSLKYYLPVIGRGLQTVLPVGEAQKIYNNLQLGWKENLNKKNKSRDVLLSRTTLDYRQKQEVMALPFFNKGANKSGLHFDQVKRRINPYDNLALRTVGGIYSADTVGRKTGKNGLESAYDEVLRGKPGWGTSRKVNGRRMTVANQAAEPGKDIVTTIDIRMQDIVEKNLMNKLREIDAQSGTAVVMDVATGEVKAISNLGRQQGGGWGEVKNYAVSDLSEPGSTFKVASMMVALEDGLVHPDDAVDVGNGTFNYAGRLITDHNANRGGYHLIDAAKSIRYSSNIGVAKLIMKAYGDHPGKYVDGIRKLGFGTDMKLEIPGYGVPVIHHPKDKNHYWSKTDLPTMSYGYTTQIPPIYTLSFFNAIANNGKWMKPMFVREIRDNGSVVERKKPEVINSRICSSATLKEIRQMLDSVVNAHDGTGKPARSDKVHIAGKTGTARLSQGQAGYAGHQVSFCGYFPADKPQYSIIVVIRNPRNGAASGGRMCGTVFKAIAEEIYASNIISNKKQFPVDTIHALEADEKKELDAIEDDGKVPDVKGMGAKDAVYAMERVGLRVNLEGKGAVVSQSISAGGAVPKGQTVRLQLK